MRQARDLGSGNLRHPLCVDHADTGIGGGFFRKNNHCNIGLDNVRSAGFLLFTSFSAVPHPGFGFAFRFRCSRTTLRKTLLTLKFRRSLCFKEFRENVLLGRIRPVGSSRLS
jgi:hypothetical protein